MIAYSHSPAETYVTSIPISHNEMHRGVHQSPYNSPYNSPHGPPYDISPAMEIGDSRVSHIPLSYNFSVSPKMPEFRASPMGVRHTHMPESHESYAFESTPYSSPILTMANQLGQPFSNNFANDVTANAAINKLGYQHQRYSDYKAVMEVQVQVNRQCPSPSLRRATNIIRGKLLVG